MPKGVYKHRTSWNKGLKMSESVKIKLRVPHIGSGIYKRNKPNWNKGGRLTKEHIIKLKNNHADFNGEKNPDWKGEDVCYAGLHMWIVKIKGKPTKCEHCGRTGLKGHQIHWANINHKYKRVPEDFIRLCVKCHRKHDYENN